MTPREVSRLRSVSPPARSGVDSERAHGVDACSHEPCYTPSSPDEYRRDIIECVSNEETGRVRVLILDSGASLHLVSRKSLSKSEKKTIRQTDHHVVLQTANGKIVAKLEVKIHVRELGITVKALVLDNDTPCVLSLGQLIEDHKLDYRWRFGHSPTLTAENGK